MRYCIEQFDDSDPPKLVTIDISQKRAIKLLSQVCYNADYVILTAKHAREFWLPGAAKLKLVPENLLEF